ncbi:hypothetical protein ALC60_06592 [Trachymyrmex zeteki]|uniref:Uncharacterized protein n=1 Tax=Mycetomoellerius zeteki TaxID=64791 RepID=A0A151X2T8_9HYME|nr:hypothetical protein ALC60_06592 [Trachymyrmex zeteki]
MFDAISGDAISGDAIRLKSQTVEAIPSVLPAKWLVTRVSPATTVCLVMKTYRTGICMIMTCGNVTLKLQVHRNNSLFHHHVLRKQYLPRMEVTTLRAHGIPDVTPRCIPGIPAAVCVDMCIGHRLNSSNVLRDEGLPGG